MNDVQVKVYVVLKHIQKDRLKPVCKNVTSNMVKNLVFWSLKMTPMNHFTPETIVDRILSSFYYLQQCLEYKYLPCYMIPERNLLQGRMDERECIILLREVQNIINEGYGFLLKNQKLSLSMELTYSYHEIARDYAQWLVEVEDLYWVFVEMAGNVRPLSDQEDANSRFWRRHEVLQGDQTISAIVCRLLGLLGMDKKAIRSGSKELADLWFTRLTDALS